MSEERGIFSLIGLIVFVILVVGGFGALISSIVNVDVGEAGVVFNKQTREISPTPLRPGWSLVQPFTTDVIKLNTWIQKEEVDASAASSNLQTAKTRVALNYHINVEDTPWVFEKIGPSYKSTIIDPAIQESVKASTAVFTAEELIIKREVVKQKIHELLAAKLNPMRIQVDSLSITNFEFSPDFQKAIEDKQTAAQLSLKAENDLTRIKVEAEQTVATAIAAAKAIEIRGKALQNNPSLVQLELAQRWNGVMPIYYTVSGSGNSGPGMLFSIPTQATPIQSK